MKLSKYAAIAKREAHCTVFRVKNNGVWLGVRGAIYRAIELPEFCGKAQTQAMLSFDEKQMDKVYLQEFDCADIMDVIGYELGDCAQNEQDTKPVSVVAMVKNTPVSAISTNDGELIFYDETYLSPLSDVIKESEYFEMKIRRTYGGSRYIAVKDGFNLLAIILPIQVVCDEYIGKLQEFEALCFEQLIRDRTRAEIAAPNDNTEEAEEEQTDMEVNDEH